MNAGIRIHMNRVIEPERLIPILCCSMLPVNPEASTEYSLCVPHVAGLSAVDRGSPGSSQAGQ